MYAERAKMSLKGSASSSHLNDIHHSVVVDAMNNLKMGGGILLLQVGGGQQGPFRGYRASSNEDAIKREFINSCF